MHFQTGMLRSRIPKFYDDDDDDDDENDKIPADHSGAGGINDKYGDYENDNAQSRNRNYDKPMKQHKNSFSSLSGLDDKLGKKHENDDFDRHPYQTSGGGSKADPKDAIKIISTPLGKVSIIYQSTNSTSNNNNKPSSDIDTKSKIFDAAANLNKFKSLYNNNNNHNSKTNRTNSNIDDITRQKGYTAHHRHNHHFQHYHNQHHNGNHQTGGGQDPNVVGSINIDDPSKIRSNVMSDKTKLLPKQITPVLTADGKVALLYRGAQDSLAGQQLPKLDVTKNTADFMPNVNSGSIDSKVNYDIVRETETKFHSDVNPPIDKDFNKTNIELPSNKNTEKLAVIVAAETTTTTVRTKLTTFAPVVNTERPILKLFKSDEQSTVRNTNEEENSILPNINRPLSEVLGIKKNQFIQFRIPDLMATATPTPAGTQDVTERTQISNTNGGASGSIDSIENPNESSPNNGFVPNFDYDYYGGVGAGAAGATNGNNENPQENDNRVDSGGQPSLHGFDDSTTISDVLSKTEVINLAIIPAFEGDLNRFQEQQQNDVSNDNNPFYNMLDRDENGNEISVHGRNSKHRQNQIKDLSALHCAMQTLIAIAALATVFGMLGAYYKQRILNQLTVLLTTIQDL